jgi:regulator of replication initiation timing
LLDGRTRLDLLSAAGVDVVDANGKVLIHHRTIQVANDAEAECLSLSLNLHRRHLTSEQKRNLIAQQLKATPEKSNRQIAKTAKVDDKTVGTVRRELESTAEIPQLEKTLGADGKVRKQPASKPRKATKPQASRKGPNLEPCDAEEAAALAADEQQKARNKDVGECISDVVARVGLRAMSIDDSRQRGNLSGPLHRAINFAVGVSQFRDDIGANSTYEITCKDAEIEELRSAKRQLEIKIGGLESEVEELKAENAALRIENHALREKLGGRLTTKPNTAGWRKWSKEKAADMVLQQQRWNYANPDDLCDLRTMEKIRNFHGLRPKLAESIAA